VTDLRGRILQRETLPVNDRDGQAALELVYELIDRLVVVTASPVLGIGLGSPGFMDAQRGLVRKSVNLDWTDLPLRDLLTARYNLPVYIANDSHVAALGEYTFGSHHLSNLVVLKVGRGVSAGIVLNGQLHYGDGSAAGEIGHVRVVEEGELCLCGHYGCLETVTSSRAILKRARAVAQQNPQSVLHRFAATPEAITTETVLQAFEAGDEEVRQIISEVGYYLGLAVANLVGVLNVQRILIGGRTARYGEALLEPICQEMRQRSMSLLAEQTTLGLSSLGEDIVIQGAAALLLANELGLA
jgi:glucokinase-like ROK family protein